MRYLSITLLALVAVFTLTSAKKDTQKLVREKPDMEAIRAAVSDPNSKMYYPKLYKQFKASDTTMTLDQMRHLYLGYIYQEDYNPYRQSQYSSRVEELYMRDKHTHAECDTIIHYAEKSLDDDPFDLRQMSFLIYAYREKKKNNMAAIMLWKLNHLLQAIISTGTGLDPENAWVVNNPQHEYNLLNFQDYIVESQKDVPPYYDYITVKPSGDKDEPKGFYFNILYLLEQYNKKFPDSL
ncbi:DUF4919 domain-containing protein [uncultured Muribaculum sp.]|uniref:DUF4919 domain-containing protein n=1 Tax=uncultured Muribaculum sp. TaxID=1918613 RepID=UPI0025AA2328|nr:DUF4919 domain-containing protein [uncultured Muribaculum sp.]